MPEGTIIKTEYLELTFKIIDQKNITKKIAEDFIDSLRKQGKVTIPTVAKIQSCLKVSLCYLDDVLIGISALKTKSSSDFNNSKADLPNLESKFVWELGYMYVDKNYRSYGISLAMTRLLLKQVQDENIMASTELFAENAMMFILRKFGFEQYGKPWPSVKHDGTLGLFLKFKNGKPNEK